MDLWTLQVLTLVCMFATNFSCFLLPCKFTWKDRNTLESPKLDLIVNLANCFSAGVFIGTFFVGLLPEVRNEFVDALEVLHFPTNFPVTEFVVVLGFFLSLFVEHFVIFVRGSCRSSKETHYVRTGVEVAISDSDAGVEVKAADCLGERNGRVTSGGDHAVNGNVITTEEDDGVFYKDMNGHAELQHDRMSDDSDAALLLHCEDEDDNLQSHLNHQHSHGGHGHSHGIDQISSNDSGVRLMVLLLSMGLHSIFEGIALGLQTRIIDLINLFIGVIIHECLVSFAIGVSLSKKKFAVRTMMLFGVAFALTIPVGQVMGILIGQQSSSSSLFTISLQAIAAGTFIHATFLEVIPEGLSGESHKALKLVFLVIGFLAIAVVTAIFHDHGHSRHGDTVSNTTSV